MNLPDTWPLMLGIIAVVFALLFLATAAEYITRRCWWSGVLRVAIVLVGSVVLATMILWMMFGEN